MRLLVCVPWYAPARGFGGGIVTSLMATVEGALGAGHDVTIATTDLLDSQSRVPPDAPIEFAGAQVLRFPNISQRLAASHAPLPRGLRPWLREHTREFQAVQPAPLPPVQETVPEDEDDGPWAGRDFAWG